MERTGKGLMEVLDDLACRGGLLGLSGISGDVRDLEVAAKQGNERARLALDAFVASIRHYLGAYLVELGGADCVVFTGGIGENSKLARREVCRDLAELGIVIDEVANETARGESRISAPTSRTQIWIVPTNEEIIVARQAKELISPVPSP
jgi:acetate kinase